MKTKEAFLPISASLSWDEKQQVTINSNCLLGSSCENLEGFYRHSHGGSSEIRNDTARAANYTYSWDAKQGNPDTVRG